MKIHRSVSAVPCRWISCGLAHKKRPISYPDRAAKRKRKGKQVCWKQNIQYLSHDDGNDANVTVNAELQGNRVKFITVSVLLLVNFQWKMPRFFFIIYKHQQNYFSVWCWAEDLLDRTACIAVKWCIIYVSLWTLLPQSAHACQKQTHFPT